MILLKSPEALKAFAHKFAEQLSPPLMITLSGDLGAGKTTFAKGFLQAFHIPEEEVTSPTFTLVESYQANNTTLYHFDWYRIDSEDELENIGIWDYFKEEAFCLIEWPEKAPSYAKAADVQVRIELAGEGRELSLEASSDRGRAALAMFEEAT